jgi:UDP:flavonoid glycosyltransferase YjiC (YdhE family)
MRRVLFVAEGITLAQIVRLRLLAGALDPTCFDVHFACCAFPPIVFDDTSFTRWNIRSVDPASALRAAESGRSVYDRATLERYADEERALFDAIEPDLVVGDFRLSLAASVPAHGVRYAALINAYWSPHALRKSFPLPEHPMVALLGEELAKRFFPLAMPLAFDAVAAPVNALRKRMGQPPIGSLLDVLTFGDDVLFADVPELVPVTALRPGQRYVGALCWSPDVPLPSLWAERDGALRIYVTLGSSGRTDLLPTVLEAVGGLNAKVLLATAGRAELARVPSNVTVAEFVSGDRAAARADVVICNGGSSTGYQALVQGAPVIGLPSNLDQYLAMTAIEEAGAGVLVRSGKASVASVRAAIDQVVRDGAHREAAARVARAFAGADAKQRFVDYVNEALPAATTGQ